MTMPPQSYDVKMHNNLAAYSYAPSKMLLSSSVVSFGVKIYILVCSACMLICCSCGAYEV